MKPGRCQVRFILVSCRRSREEESSGDVSVAGNGMSQINRNWSSYFYDSFTRAQWARFGAGPHRLSAEALASLKGINEPMSVSEVDEVVGPLCGLLDQQMAANPSHPYVIAVSGSVAVGKSTFSRCATRSTAAERRLEMLKSVLARS